MSGSFVIASRVWQTTATTGTGDISFDASVPTGYRSFVSAIGNGNLCPYAIDDGVNWEIGIGTVSSGTPDSMARTTVKSNSLGTTAKINFGTGTKTVKVCPTGSSYVYLNSAASTDNLLIASSSGGFDPITISAALKKLLTTDGDVALNDSGTVVRAPVAAALKKLLATDGDIAQNIGGTVVARTGPPNRNTLINPSFAIDQRNAGASTATSDDTYCFDRWYALTQTAAINVSQLTEPEDGYPYAIRLTQNQASAQRMGLAQIIEGVNCKHLRGKSGTLVPRVRCSSSQAIRYAILGWTGTEDAVTSDVVNSWTNGTFTAGQFFNSTTLSVLAVGAQTPSANTWTSLAALTATMGSSFKNVIVFVWTEGTAAQNVTLDIDYIQLEAGAVATPFEVRDYPSEQARCLRYFERIDVSNSTYLFVGQAMTTGAVRCGLFFKKKRVAPTLTLPSTTDAYFLNASGSAPSTIGTNAVPVTNTDNAYIFASGYTSGFVAGNASTLFAANPTKILIDAEL